MDEPIFMQMNHILNLVHRAGAKGSPQLPQSQGKILRILNKHGEVAQKELADCMQIRPASLSELLSKLEQKGYTVKRRGEDKRNISISLTESGVRAAQALEKANQQVLSDIFDSLSGAEKKTLSRLLIKVISSVKDNTGLALSGFCVECGLCAGGYKRLAVGE